MDFKKVIKSRETRLKIINGILRFIPTKSYLKLIYKLKTGRKLNLKNPKGFNEKLNWLKVYDKHEEYTDLVDKYKVREHVANLIGEEYLIPLLGKWDKFDDIDFDTLPDSFVLKCNHDSGSVKIIDDKTQINKKELKKFFKNRLKFNAYYMGREYPYKKVKPCIIAEQKLGGNTRINDYKFFCFNGEPKIMFVASDRNKDVKLDFYDMDFNHLEMRNNHENSGKIIEKPKNFEKMKELSSILSKGIKHVRMDFYEVDGKVYFGEYTFFNASGLNIYRPYEKELLLGDMIDLN